MTTLLGESDLTAASTAMPAERPQRLLLDALDWPRYLAIGEALGDRPGLRLTYDRGSLEFMTTSPKHEIFKKHFARFIEFMAEELEMPFATAGQMTFQNEALGKGLEADDCFCFEHEMAMRGKLTWDAGTDPPPDLGLEIEIGRSTLNRMGTYAALRVAEVWRFDGQRIVVHRLQTDGAFGQTSGSQIFAGFPLNELPKFLELAQSTDIFTVIRTFANGCAKGVNRASSAMAANQNRNENRTQRHRGL